MTQITSKVCQYIRPDSSYNPDAQLYEYYLAWIGLDGSVGQWLFEDSILIKNRDSSVVNTRNENITKLITNANRSVLVIAEDLTENEFDTISKIIDSVEVWRVYRDGTKNKVSIATTEIEKPKSQFRYNLELEIVEQQDKIMR